ncbi:MAG: N-acetylglucosamine-6-phosphate deacetylase [Psychromonas sp.]
MEFDSSCQHLRFKRVLTESGWLSDAVITIREGLFADIQPYDVTSTVFNWDQIEYFDADLMPGLIDTHIHGAMGCDVMDATHHSLNNISLYLAKFGIVGFLATTVTSTIPKIEAALRQIANSKKQGVDGAELLGGYLEGPYFTEIHRGAHPNNLLRDIDLNEIKQFIDIADSSLKVIALAPEKPGAISAIKYLKDHHINTMIAHTNAGYEQTTLALDAGAKGIVHCYNGMKGIHHRDTGTVGAGLTHPSAFIEIINDGHHVHASAIDIAYRCCQNRLLLISDSMRAAGMPNGKYELGEYLITMQDGVVRTDEGSLAGSTLCLLDAVYRTEKDLKIPLERAWELASLSPAKVLNIDNQLGSIAIGKKASIVAINSQGVVLHTWVSGELVYSKE